MFQDYIALQIKLYQMEVPFYRMKKKFRKFPIKII